MIIRAQGEKRRQNTHTLLDINLAEELRNNESGRYWGRRSRLGPVQGISPDLRLTGCYVIGVDHTDQDALALFIDKFRDRSMAELMDMLERDMFERMGGRRFLYADHPSAS